MAACVNDTCQPCFDDITAGHTFTCLHRTDDTAWCWGSNSLGQIGDGTNTDALTPKQVQGIATIRQVEGGRGHACAVDDAGHAYCWGGNFHGELGEGGVVDTPTPVLVSDLSDVVQVTAGDGFSCARLGSGALYCWGHNLYGQLGTNDTASSAVPRQTNGLQNAAYVTAGRNHTCAIDGAGAVACWGDNDIGQVGVGSQWESVLTPTPVLDIPSGATMASGGYGQSCAIVGAGSLYCWGYNGNGELGDGTTTIRWTANPVIGISDEVVDVSTSQFRTCAVTADGTALCWGLDLYGSTGTGTGQDTILVPTKVNGLPASVLGIAAGEYHTCAILTDGTVWCWGANEDGQLGQNHKDIVVDGIPRKVKALSCQ